MMNANSVRLFFTTSVYSEIPKENSPWEEWGNFFLSATLLWRRVILLNEKKLAVILTDNTTPIEKTYAPTPILARLAIAIFTGYFAFKKRSWRPILTFPFCGLLGTILKIGSWSLQKEILLKNKKCTALVNSQYQSMIPTTVRTMSEPETPGLVSLPNEILLHLFGFLNFESVHNFKLACKRIYLISTMKECYFRVPKPLKDLSYHQIGFILKKPALVYYCSNFLAASSEKMEIKYKEITYTRKNEDFEGIRWFIDEEGQVRCAVKIDNKYHLETKCNSNVILQLINENFREKS